jgi:Uma2 family endonuclease
MGMPAAIERRWTAAEVRALPYQEGKHYEVIDGELFVSPGPPWPHQRIARIHQTRLQQYVEAEQAGDVLGGPAEVEFDTHTLVQPDLFVVPLVNGKRPAAWEDVGAVLLVVEILSPFSGRRDRVVKRRKYREVGVEYWIVDLEARALERWTPGATDAEHETDEISWQAPGASIAITLDLLTLFADALDR